MLRLGEVQPEEAGGGDGGAVEPLRLLARKDDVVLQPVDAFVAGDEALEGVFVAQEQADQDRRGEADREAEDGDPGIEAVAADVAERG